MDEGAQWLVTFFGDAFQTFADNLSYVVNVSLVNAAAVNRRVPVNPLTIISTND